MSKLPSPRRKSPEKKSNNVQDIIIPAAKRNFLTSTEKITKVSPLKRQASPDKLPPAVDEDGLILSPGSRSKIGSLAFGTPPKKEAKVWKSRWQVATLNGGVTEKGKKKKTNEATKLLDDEGVIQMLNRVPSVHGIMPKSASNSSGRAQRARSVVAVKPKNKQNKINVKRPESGETKKVTKLDLQQTIRLEPSELATPPKSGQLNGDSKDEVKMEEFVSPKRAVRNISRDYSTQQELHENLSSIQSDDCFVYLTELPSEQLELLMNCDIRYSLPKQGAPVLRKPSNQVSKQKQSKDEKPNDNLKAVIEPAASKPPRCSPDQHKVVSSTSSEIMTTAALVKVKPVSVSMGGMLAVELPKQKPSPTLKLPPLPQPDQVENRLQDLLQHYKTDEGEMRDPNNLIPGQFNQIFVRFYETFAQITISTNKIKMKGSLNPSMIDEITHALNYTAEVKRLKGVIITGVGNIFCQGVDLNFLCNDNQDRRRNNAAQMAAAIERLVITLSNYPKLLVAAVNGAATGLGVTILPLFDIVYANDKATFNTFFTRLGQIPEGAASVTLPQLCSGLGGPINEMLLFGRVLTASEMVGVGLVTQTFFPGRLMEELIPRMRRACGENNSGLQWNKLLLKQHQKSQVEQVITGETELLTDMWSSKDFHVNLVNFINTEKCLQFQNPN